MNFSIFSGVNKSARERIGRQTLSQKVPSKKRYLGVMFSPRNYRENARSKSANFEGRHSGGHLLGRPLLFTSDLWTLRVAIARIAFRPLLSLSPCWFLVESNKNFAKCKSRFSGRGLMARSSSLNCLSCRNPYQAPDSLNCLPPFH